MKKYERLGHVRNRRRSPELNAWTNVVARCTNPRRSDYRYYGGRGITVCERWRGSFAAFLEDMGSRPDGASIDRIDNAMGYEPGNCRWATKHQQMQNTRSTRLITFAGRTQGLNVWAKEIGIAPSSLSDRLSRGWPLERALTVSRRTETRGRLIAVHGGALSPRETAILLGVNYSTLRARLAQGWSAQQIQERYCR